MYVRVGMGKGRTYDATWVDVSGAECIGRFVVSVAQIMQAKKSAITAGLPICLFSD